MTYLLKEENLGCRDGPASAISWFFDNNEGGVILEDDCVPHPSFLPYCAEMLERYRDDERVALISGNNFQARPLERQSYYFSAYPYIWGWASWRRFWRCYDLHMRQWPDFKNGKWLGHWAASPAVALYWEQLFDTLYANRLDAWDGQVVFTMLSNSMLAAVPAVNLVSNIGFGPDATHTIEPCWRARLPVFPMQFPLQHAPYLMRDVERDRCDERHVYGIEEEERHGNRTAFSSRTIVKIRRLAHRALRFSSIS